MDTQILTPAEILPVAEVAPAPAALRTLSFDDIMAADDMEVVPVTVPEWRGQVFIRPLAPGENSDALEEATVGDGGTGTKVDASLYGQGLLRRSLVEPVLSKEQIAALWTRKSDRAVRRIVTQINKVNGFGEKVHEEIEAEFRG